MPKRGKEKNRNSTEPYPKKGGKPEPLLYFDAKYVGLQVNYLPKKLSN